jgi:hypothetical protein
MDKVTHVLCRAIKIQEEALLQHSAGLLMYRRTLTNLLTHCRI